MIMKDVPWDPHVWRTRESWGPDRMEGWEQGLVAEDALMTRQTLIFTESMPETEPERQGTRSRGDGRDTQRDTKI